jgi:hypothetical protein
VFFADAPRQLAGDSLRGPHNAPNRSGFDSHGSELKDLK